MASRGGTSTADARSLLWTPSDSIKETNRRRIIRAVMVEPGSQVSIARLTHLSQATVSGVVNELQQEGIFRVTSGDGERGKRVRIGAVRGLAVGIEVNHNSVAVAVRPVNSSAMEYESASFSTDQVANAWLREGARLVRELVARTGLDEGDIVSIGVGIPAAVDVRVGEITQVASAIDWELRGRVHDLVNEQFPNVPVVLDNESNFAAFGESVYGAGRGHETVLFVKASIGIGAGLINGGVIYRGRHGLACELGHLTMDPQGIVCRCGNRGCLETVAGGARLVEQVRQAYAGYRVDLPTTLESVIERARGGDVVCARVLGDAARNIGLALARVCNLLNPEVVVFGGELGRASEMLIPPMADGLRRYALRGMFEAKEPTTIVGSELGLSAGARGALAFALNVDRTVVV